MRWPNWKSGRVKLRVEDNCGFCCSGFEGCSVFLCVSLVPFLAFFILLYSLLCVLPDVFLKIPNICPPVPRNLFSLFFQRFQAKSVYAIISMSWRNMHARVKILLFVLQRDQEKPLLLLIL